MSAARFAAALASSAVLAAGVVPAWEPPVDAPVVRPFKAGRGRYEVGGHGGLDYRVPPATVVRAVGPGVVAFAGAVGGSPFVVVAHGEGVRTSYAPVAAEVARGDRVDVGSRLGVVSGPVPGDHPPGVLHLGLRIDGVPHDPALLFGAPDLTRRVSLAPLDGPVPRPSPVPVERQGILRELGEAGQPWWSTRDGRSPLDRLGRALRTLGRRSGDGVRDRLEAVRARAGRLWRGVERGVTVWSALAPELSGVLAVHGPELVWEAGKGVRDWWRLRRRCTPGPHPSDADAAGNRPHRDGGGTLRRLVAVAGVNSSTRPDGSTFDLPTDALGYRPDAVTWFSYAPGGGHYEPIDTHGGPAEAAGRLAAQLRHVARRHPGTRVDLVGHSLGGLVVEGFLKEHYAGHESLYPPLGRVVTLSAPHRGSALATQGQALTAHPAGAWVARLLARLVPGLPEPDSGVAREVAEHSEYLARLHRTPLPPGVAMTTIGAADDVVVTADRARVAGAEHVVVDPAGASDHSAVVDDPAAVDAVRRALAGAPPRCRSLLETVRFRVEPSLLHALIRAPTDLARPAG